MEIRQLRRMKRDALDLQHKAGIGYMGHAEMVNGLKRVCKNLADLALMVEVCFSEEKIKKALSSSRKKI